MILEKGCIVSSKAGHDKGHYYVCIGITGNVAQLVDGNHRKFVRPKFKNIKHLRATKCYTKELGMGTDEEIRTLLKAFTAND